MISESNLIGWLCIARAQFSHEYPFTFPIPVSDELERRGWAKWGAVDWDGLQPMTITAAGHAVADLNDPEWSIEYVEAEST